MTRRTGDTYSYNPLVYSYQQQLNSAIVQGCQKFINSYPNTDEDVVYVEPIALRIYIQAALEPIRAAFNKDSRLTTVQKDILSSLLDMVIKYYDNIFAYGYSNLSCFPPPPWMQVTTSGWLQDKWRRIKHAVNALATVAVNMVVFGVVTGWVAATTICLPLLSNPPAFAACYTGRRLLAHFTE